MISHRKLPILYAYPIYEMVIQSFLAEVIENYVMLSS